MVTSLVGAVTWNGARSASASARSSTLGPTGGSAHEWSRHPSLHREMAAIRLPVGRLPGAGEVNGLTGVIVGFAGAGAALVFAPFPAGSELEIQTAGLLSDSPPTMKSDPHAAATLASAPVGAPNRS